MNSRLAADRFRKCMVIVITFFVAGCLLISTIGHLVKPYAFLLSILRYEIVSGEMANLVAMVLPAFQFVLAVSMFSLQTPRIGAIGATLLILLYTLLQASALFRGLDISCGCFGSFSEPISWWTIGRNVGLLAGCLWLCFNVVKTSSSPTTGTSKLELAG